MTSAEISQPLGYKAMRGNEGAPQGHRSRPPAPGPSLCVTSDHSSVVGPACLRLASLRNEGAPSQAGVSSVPSAFIKAARGAAAEATSSRACSLRGATILSLNQQRHL